MMRLLKKIKKKRVLIPLTIVVAMIGLVVFSQTQQATVDFSSTAVERIDLVQSVEETGTVKSQIDLAYGWEISGRVATIEKNVGDVVLAGDIVATLENAQETSRLQEAQALLAAAQAQLNLRVVGASEQQIASSLASVASAEAALVQAQAKKQATETAGLNAIATAEQAVDDAKVYRATTNEQDEQDIVQAYESGIRTAKSSLTTALDVVVLVADLQEDYTDLSDSYPYGLETTNRKKDAAALLLGGDTNGEWEADRLLGLRGGARGLVNDLGVLSTREEIDTALLQLKAALDAVSEMADVALIALKQSTVVVSTDETALDTATTNANTATANLVTSQQTIASEVLAKATNDANNAAAVVAAERSLTNAQTEAERAKASAAADVLAAEAAVRQAQASHEELITGPRSVDIASLRADVARQSANVAIAREGLEKTQLVALADGTISVMDVSVGETVTANQEVFGLVSSHLNIEVDISETDIAKVKNGDPVEITLDAFGDDRIFMGMVVDVEPAETEISGVVYYKTTVQLDLEEENAEGVRPGMTANVKIVSNTKPGVLVLPRRAVLRNGREYVRVLTNEKGAYEERDVTTGLQGDDGLIEIISGLKEGEEVVTFIKEN